MKIPFLHFFRKEKTTEAGGGVAVAPPPAPVRPEKPASERFGKTVLPNVSRFVGIESAANFPLTPAGTNPGGATGNLPVGFTSPGAATMPPPAPRRISLGANGSILTSPSPVDETAIAIAERKIALALADLLPQIPPDLLNPQAIDPERHLLFRAAELERGMSTGQPCASLRAIYQQAPELFTREVREADPRKVALPFGKVLEQFANFQVRWDQVRDENLPQVETPFLHVALEDGQRFATTPAPKSEPVAVEASTAEPTPASPRPVIAAPEISATSATKPVAAAAVEAKVLPAPIGPGVAGSARSEPKRIAPIRLPIPPLAEVGNPGQTSAAAPALPASTPPASTPPPTPAATSAPAPIRLSTPPVAAEFSPNGTGVPASERVPASSGQPVPTPLPSPFAPLPLTRISMKVTAPANDLREPSHPQNWSLRPAATGESAPALEQKEIRLPLRPVLAAVPPFQLSGPPLAEVTESAMIEFPLNLIKPQLSLGRVEVTPAQFQAALPAELRDRFQIEDKETPIPLPLPQILQNLPNESLQMRRDQEESQLGAFFETPFSEKAAEDAARMKGPSGPIGKPGAAVVAAGAVAVARNDDRDQADSSADTRPESATPATVPAAAPPAKAEPETGEPLDAKAVVAEASRLPGVQACAVVFSDGLGLAHNISPDFDVDALCAIAPTIMKRIDAQIASAKLGALAGITLFCAKAAVTFFAHGNICLAALHRRDAELTSASRSQLGRVTEALARTYRPPA